MRQLVIELPLPPAELSPNARVHHFARARAAADTRTDAAYTAMRALDDAGFRAPPRWRRARVTYVWRTRRGAHPDPDNAIARCKPVLDGLVDAGVLENDRWIEIGMRFERGPPALRVCVEPSDPH